MQFMTIFILTNIRKIGRNYVPLTLPSTALLPLSRSVTCCWHAPSLQNDRALYKTKSLEKDVFTQILKKFGSSLSAKRMSDVKTNAVYVNFHPYKYKEN
jgi:hypothetical protein